MAIKKLRLGIPKGSLQGSTIRLFEKAGFKITVGERSYRPSIDDDEVDVVMFRAQEMSMYVESGFLDCGITGSDWILENNSKVIKVSELNYSKKTSKPVRWVLAVAEDSKIRSIRDLEGKRIATELVKVTQRYLRKKGINAEVEFSWGATEIKVDLGVDAIVELTETGSSLRANRLRIVDTVCTSITEFIANKNSYKDRWKKDKMNNIVLLLQGAILAEGKVGLKMNVPKNALSKVLDILPAMKKPTVSNLSQEGWFDVETIIDEDIVRVLIPRLKEAGASGIIEYPLNKVIY